MNNQKKKLNFYGTLAQGQGYSGTAEKMALALDKYFDVRVMSFTEYKRENVTSDGLELRAKPFELAETGIVYGFPNAFTSCVNKNKIGFTMFETSKLPRTSGIPNDWAGETGDPEKNINLMDIVLVPCEHNKKLLEKEGVTIPIKVVHLGIDPQQYPKIIRPKRDTFTFLSLGTLTIRKNPGAIIGAFLELFKDNPNVRLVLKTQSGTLAHIQLPYKNITIIDEYSTQEQIWWYYKEADAFLFPTRGEGFGLPPMEAMATGLPTVIANHTGMAEFCNKEYNYPIPVAKETPAIRFPKKWGDVGNWYEPDYQALKDAMLDIYTNREESYNKGLKASDWVHSNFTFDHTARDIVKLVQELEDSKLDK